MKRKILDNLIVIAILIGLVLVYRITGCPSRSGGYYNGEIIYPEGFILDTLVVTDAESLNQWIIDHPNASDIDRALIINACAEKKR